MDLEVLQYLKSIFLGGQMPKSSSNKLLKLIFNFFHGDLYYFVEYMRSSKLIIKINAQKQMHRFCFGHKIYDLNYFELDFFFIFLNSLYTCSHCQISF